MKLSVTLLLTLLIATPELYAMDKQFEREQEAKAKSAAANLADILAQEEAENAAAQVQELADIAHCDTATKLSEEILADSCGACAAKAASLPTAIQEHVWSFATDRKKRFIGNHMEQLLPASIEWVNDGSIFDSIAQYKATRVTLDDVNQERAQAAAFWHRDMPPITELPADKLYYLGDSYWEGGRKTYYKHLIYPVTSGHESGGKTIPGDAILSTQRGPLSFFSRNQFYALYYANGTTLFKIHDAKRSELEKLSDKQLDYIISLHQTRARNLAERNTAEIYLTEEQIKIHKSLPTNMRINLQNVYDLAEIKQERSAANRRKKCCTALAFTSLAATLGLQHLYGTKQV